MSAKELDYKWPGDLPKRCPPEEAIAAKGRFYRAIKHTPPVDSDFVRWIDEPHNLGKTKTCDACAVSVYSSAESLKKALFERFPNRWNKQKGCGIAELSLTATVGVTQQGGPNPNHYNVWVQDGTKLNSFVSKLVE